MAYGAIKRALTLASASLSTISLGWIFVRVCFAVSTTADGGVLAAVGGCGLFITISWVMLLFYQILYSLELLFIPSLDKVQSRLPSRAAPRCESGIPLGSVSL